MPICPVASPRSEIMRSRQLKALSVALALPLVAALAGPSAPSSAAVPALPAGWKVDMSEDFNSISTSRWNIKNNTSASNEDSYLLARNITTKDGMLRVQGKKEVRRRAATTPPATSTPAGKYSLPNYFRAEVRAKVPFEQGMWAAPLWFRPAGGGNGEIDMVETLRQRAGQADLPPDHPHRVRHYPQAGLGHQALHLSRLGIRHGLAHLHDGEDPREDRDVGRRRQDRRVQPQQPHLVQHLLRDRAALEHARSTSRSAASWGGPPTPHDWCGDKTAPCSWTTSRPGSPADPEADPEAGPGNRDVLITLPRTAIRTHGGQRLSAERVMRLMCPRPENATVRVVRRFRT